MDTQQAHHDFRHRHIQAKLHPRQYFEPGWKQPERQTQMLRSRKKDQTHGGNSIEAISWNRLLVWNQCRFTIILGWEKILHSIILLRYNMWTKHGQHNVCCGQNELFYNGVCMEMFIGWNWIIQTKALDGFVSFNLASSSFTGTLQFGFASDPVMIHYCADWKMLIALSNSAI